MIAKSYMDHILVLNNTDDRSMNIKYKSPRFYSIFLEIHQKSGLVASRSYFTWQWKIWQFAAKCQNCVIYNKKKILRLVNQNTLKAIKNLLWSTFSIFSIAHMICYFISWQHIPTAWAWYCTHIAVHTVFVFSWSASLCTLQSSLTTNYQGNSST